ncbi:MAG: hypothetical protein ACLFR1_16275 [Spirochaetia bacterium]
MYIPEGIVILLKQGDDELAQIAEHTKDFPKQQDEPLVYVCADKICSSPIDTTEKLKQELK